MRTQTLSLLRCPNGCAGELSVQEKERQGDRLIHGVLVCPACGSGYPVTEGIARMLPGFLTAEAAAADAVEVERKRSEMAARDAQVEDYDRMRYLTLYGKLFEIPATLAELSLRPTDVLLEAGCGTGRMTLAFAARCGTLISVDYSLESLRVCQRKLQAAGVQNVDLIQADNCALPLADHRFDKAVSCGVLEHVPTVESRSKMIAEMARVTKAGGAVVLSAYCHNLFTRLFGEKEGAHAGGIYFFRYNRRELHAALARHLDVQRITGKLQYYYLARCRKPDAA
ncbi:MAG TPA: methyltransferase domain-containing protein [Chthonomonadaceae bacterium]|nr:methyltransferase domain-containing protein [Chthonomonadaceae bacterium]